MADFLSNIPLFPVVLTLAAYSFGRWCQKKWNSPLCNPILIAVAVVVLTLVCTKIPYIHYKEGTRLLNWLLTPATVAMALPLYNQFKVLKKNLPAALAGITAGTLTSLVTIALLCRLLGLEQTVAASLLPKSVTTAIGIVLCEQAGGAVGLTTAAIIVTGILGSMTGPWLCRLLGITDPVAQGVAMGTASHVIGTAKANEMGKLQGAVGSLSLTVAGILTAIAFPIVILLF